MCDDNKAPGENSCRAETCDRPANDEYDAVWSDAADKGAELEERESSKV